jgi:hypothetical protein
VAEDQSAVGVLGGHAEPLRVVRVAADHPVQQAAVLTAPVIFRIRPAALRVRVAAGHPGTSPSAIEPAGAVAALRALTRIAREHEPVSVTVTRRA